MQGRFVIFDAGIHAVAMAREYPSRVIRLVVPYPPGGSVDIVGRIVGQKLVESLGQQVLVDNRGGASGAIGTAQVARAAPDGYTLVMGGPTSMATNPNVNTKLPYHPIRDFEPIILIAHQPDVLVVHPVVPVRTVKELIALAKAKPGTLTVATSGLGGSQHMAATLFTTMTGATFTDVPYKGGAPARTGLLSGEVHLMFQTLITEIDTIKSGKLRALAVTTTKRSPAVPDIPTMSEAGVPGYSFHGWHGLLAPAATPKSIIARLNKEVRAALEATDVKKQFSKLGLIGIEGEPDDFRAFMRQELEKYAKLVKASGMKVE